MIAARRLQRHFADGFIAEAVEDLWEPWMRHADKALEDDTLLLLVMSENSKGLRSTFFLWNDGQMVWPQQYRTWHTIVKPPRTTNSCHCPDPSQRHVRADPLSVRAQRLAANRKKHSIAVNR